MSKPHVTYAPRAGNTPEEEVSALAAVYRFIVLDCHAEKKAVPDRRHDEGGGDVSVELSATSGQPSALGR